MKETLKPNEVAATLFVGVGGIGSKIIKRVAELAAGDNTEAVRFVTMDTDVNDLEQVERGNKVIAIQTSSPRSVRDYLDSDGEAAAHWFPVNNILDDKTVSEGAGQVRAISRLALNATIRNGKIRLLYNAIDDLFLKNGASKCQALKVVIASTAAGGTGSGIAMEVGMLIRHYIKKKYPESACIIRGFLLLPGVLDTVVDNDTERDSLRRNGYATIKEINAFMMKGSGFFKSEPRLARYKDLHITIPTSDGGYEKLDYLPFDFCFLLDRTDGIQKSMRGLAQYREYAAQSIYEQNIGPMRFSASSKEDNVIKEFSDPKKLGRCRFGGAGAATIRYPYARICDFIALDWAQQLLFGKLDESMDEQTRERMIERTWLKYDVAFERKFKEWESTPGAAADEEPTRSLVYTQTIEESLGGKGDNFSDMLFDKYLKTKVAEVVSGAEKDNLADDMEEVVGAYLQAIVTGMLEEKIRPMLDISDEDISTASTRAAERGAFAYRFDAIQKLRGTCDYGMVRSKAKQFVRGIFESRASVAHGGLKDYMIQRYLSNNGSAIHPNAVRYLLYKLQQAIQEVRETISVNSEEFEKSIHEIISSETKKKMYDLVDGQPQETLQAMCQGIDALEGPLTALNGDKSNICNQLLDSFYEIVVDGYQKMAKRAICDAAEHYVNALIAAYEKFYNTFRDKSVSIIKRKDAIREELRFRKGDCLLNLFSDPGYLDMLAEQNRPMGGAGAADLDMFIRIFDMVRENSEIEEHNRYDEFSEEQAHDVFEEVMIGYFRELVEKQRGEELDVDILHAIKLQFRIRGDLAKRGATEEEKLKISKQMRDADALRMYINKILNIGRNLATPGICKKSFEESRDVNAVAYSVYCKDGGGIRVGEYFDDKNASESVSRYEARFFRSIYVVMPTQIFQFCAPRIDAASSEPRVDLINADVQCGAGESFLRYQTYMEEIGPDSRMNSIITPHVDTRWNSISVMPELDLEYQDQLMKHIQKAFVYGFLYGVIARYAPSRHDPKRFLYRYRDGRNGFKSLIVSNKTKCDKLYEVLDALYFDRAAVTSIHKTIAQSRDADEKRSATYERTIFKSHVNGFTRAAIIGEEEAGTPGKASLFELVLLYFNSLPPRQRDAAEIEVMVDAVIEVIQTEVAMFTEDTETNPLLGMLLAEQYNLLNYNYRQNTDLLGMGIAMRNNDVMMIIRRKIEDKLFDLDITMPELAPLD